MIYAYVYMQLCISHTYSYIHYQKTSHVFEHEMTQLRNSERNESQPFQAATLVVDWPLEDILDVWRQLLN